jgi:hypothetical protein
VGRELMEMEGGRDDEKSKCGMERIEWSSWRGRSWGDVHIYIYE